MVHDTNPQSAAADSGELSDADLLGVVGGADTTAAAKSKAIEDKKKSLLEAGFEHDAQADIKSIVNNIRGLTPALTGIAAERGSHDKKSDTGLSSHEAKSLHATEATVGAYVSFLSASHTITSEQVKALDAVKNAVAGIAKLHDAEDKPGDAHSKKADAIAEKLTDTLDETLKAFIKTIPADVQDKIGKGQGLPDLAKVGQMHATPPTLDPGLKGSLDVVKNKTP